MDIYSIVRKDFLVFFADESLSEMIGKLNNSTQKSGLVFSQNKYLGTILHKKLLKTRLKTTKVKTKSVVQKTPQVNLHADIIETAYLMYNSNFNLLPVEDRKKIIGTVNELQLAHLAVRLPELEGLKVKDLRLIKLPLLDKTDQIATALEIMYKRHVEHVPIFDQGKLYGIISYSDYLRKYLPWVTKRETSTKMVKIRGANSAEVDRPHLSSLPVSSFSTNDNLVEVEKNESVKNVTTLMLKDNISCVLVMDKGEYVGLLNAKNILRAVSSLKIPENFNLHFIGWSNLKVDDYERECVEKICSNESFKLQRIIKDPFDLKIHLKEYSQTGNRVAGKQHKYSVHLKIEHPGKVFAVSQDDWDLRRAFHKAFANLQNAAKKSFK